MILRWELILKIRFIRLTLKLLVVIVSIAILYLIKDCYINTKETWIDLIDKMNEETRTYEYHQEIH